MGSILDSAEVVRAYTLDVELHGKRGAYRRVGAYFHKSDERIRQIITEHQATAVPDDLAYVPPPFALPTPEPRPLGDDLLRQLLCQIDAKPDPPLQTHLAIESAPVFGIAELLAQLPPLLETRQDVMKALILFGEVTEPPAFDLGLGRHTAALSTAAMVFYGARWPGWAFALLPVALLMIWLALPR